MAEITIGCDLGDRVSELFVLPAEGEASRARVKTTPEGFREGFKGPPAHVIIEVGPHSRWASRVLAELGHKVTIANPRRLKLISANDSKTDRNDAELLARLGRVDTALLAPIEHRGTEAQADLAVAKARDILVESRTRLISCTRGMAKSAGALLPRCSAEAFHKKARAQIPGATPRLGSAFHYTRGARRGNPKVRPGDHPTCLKVS